MVITMPLQVDCWLEATYAGVIKYVAKMMLDRYLDGAYLPSISQDATLVICYVFGKTKDRVDRDIDSAYRKLIAERDVQFDGR